MKYTQLIILISLSVLCVRASVVTEEEYGVTATFPVVRGWSGPVHTKHSHCCGHVLAWSAKNQARKQMIYLSIIDAPVPDENTSFPKVAKEWEEGVRESSKEITSAEFTTLGGLEAYKITGKAINFGREYFIARWMSQIGNVTFQVSFVSEKPLDLKAGVFHDFLSAFAIRDNKPYQTVDTTSTGAPH